LFCGKNITTFWVLMIGSLIVQSSEITKNLIKFKNLWLKVDTKANFISITKWIHQIQTNIQFVGNNSLVVELNSISRRVTNFSFKFFVLWSISQPNFSFILKVVSFEFKFARGINLTRQLCRKRRRNRSKSIIFVSETR
jgi:hypothetical protein